MFEVSTCARQPWLAPVTGSERPENSTVCCFQWFERPEKCPVDIFQRERAGRPPSLGPRQARGMSWREAPERGIPQENVKNPFSMNRRAKARENEEWGMKNEE